MFCDVTNLALMARVGPLACERLLTEPHVQPKRFAGRPLSGFVSIDSAGYYTDEALSK